MDYGKQLILADWLEVDPDDLEPTKWDDSTFELGKREYMVLLDDEADDRAKSYIEDSLWAFNAWFLAGFTGLPQAVFEALQPQCEDANEAILAIVENGDGLDKLVEQAISADGRGHFLSTYDGREHEVDAKFCVECGSTNLDWDTSEPGTPSCRDCGAWFTSPVYIYRVN